MDLGAEPPYINYRKIPKISPVVYIFQRPFLNLPFLLCFTLYLRAIFHIQAPWGAYIWRGDLTVGFYVTNLGGLYLEGPIHGGAYFQNFTVC